MSHRRSAGRTTRSRAATSPKITFEDDTHYALLRSGCGGPTVDGEGDPGCSESGTYSLNLRTGILSLRSSGSNATRTIPFATRSFEAAEVTSDGLKVEGLTSGATPLTKDAGPLTETSLIACFGATLNEGDPTSRAYGLHCPIQNEVSRDGILARAQLWVNAELPYCQAPNDTADGDRDCASVCRRPSEPTVWDPYRSDCSGFISWSWGLPPPGRTTRQFADVTMSISGDDLQPGDALNRFGVHVVMFLRWVDSKHTSAVFQEEPGCSATPSFAHEFTSNVTIDGSNVFVAHNGETFQALRFTGLCSSPCQTGDTGTSTGPSGSGTGSRAAGSGSGTGIHPGTGTGTGTAALMGSGSGSGPAPQVSCTTGFGKHGECIDATMCTSMGGSATSDLCPGDDNIQCCTVSCGFLGFGECIDTALCKSIGGTPAANMCPGDDNIQCCSR